MTTLPIEATLIGEFTPGSDDWHAARVNGVGGSEIAAVLGISPYESKFSLWHRKRGLVGPVEESPEMYWGKLHEPTICGEFAHRHPDLDVIPAGTFHGPGRPWQIVNPDRLAIVGNEVEVVEAKTARDDSAWGEEGTDDIPVYYRAQVLWYMDGLGARRAHLPVLIAGSDYREYVVEYDPAEALMMRQAAAAFMQSLADERRPALDGHEATLNIVKRLPEGVDGPDAQVTAELRDRYFTALSSFKAAEEEKRACTALLLDAIGTGRRAHHGDQLVATRAVRDGRTHSLQPARNRRSAA